MAVVAVVAVVTAVVLEQMLNRQGATVNGTFYPRHPDWDDEKWNRYLDLKGRE